MNWCIHDRTALAEAEVEYENHTSPSIWVRFALTSDPAAIDPALAGHNGLRADLDHHAVDHSGQPGDRVSSEVTSTSAVDVAGDGLHRRRGSAEGDGGEAAAGATPQTIARIPGRAARRRGFPPSVSGARFARHSGRSRDAGTGHRRGPHGSRPRPGRLRRSGSSTASRCTVRWMPRADFSTPKAPPGQLPEELIGKTVWEGNPIVIELLKDARRAAGAWRRSSTAIRTAGAATTRPSSAPPSSGSSAWTATTSASTRSKPSSSVKWMPAWGEERISNMIATRPDWCISRQRVWGVPIIVFYCEGCREPLTDRKILDRHRRRCFAEHTADVWYERTAAELLPAGCARAPSAAARNSAKRTTFWTCGSIPARATWRC